MYYSFRDSQLNYSYNDYIFNLNSYINANRGSHNENLWRSHVCVSRNSFLESHSACQSRSSCPPHTPISPLYLLYLSISVFVIQFEFNVTLKASFTVICK